MGKMLSPTRYPVVLIHGIGYSDESYPQYWGSIPEALRQNGTTVYFGGQDSYAKVTDNAAKLKTRILELLESEDCEKVNLIAHSKGGIEARYMITCLDMADRVASLTTIATPHRGIGAIDIWKEKAPGILRQLYGLFALMVRVDGGDRPKDLSVFDQMSEDYMGVFNELVPDKAGVYYQSWACDMVSKETDPVMGAFFELIRRSHGMCDGLVPVESAMWGNFRGVYRGPDGLGISHPMACGGRAKWMEKKGRTDLSLWYIDMVRELGRMGF